MKKTAQYPDDINAADQPLSATHRCHQCGEMPFADLNLTCANQAAQEAILVKRSTSTVPADG